MIRSSSIFHMPYSIFYSPGHGMCQSAAIRPDLFTNTRNSYRWSNVVLYCSSSSSGVPSVAPWFHRQSRASFQLFCARAGRCRLCPAAVISRSTINQQYGIGVDANTPPLLGSAVAPCRGGRTKQNEERTRRNLGRTRFFHDTYVRVSTGEYRVLLCSSVKNGFPLYCPALISQVLNKNKRGRQTSSSSSGFSFFESPLTENAPKLNEQPQQGTPKPKQGVNHPPHTHTHIRSGSIVIS